MVGIEKKDFAISYSRHADEQIKERQIAKVTVEETLRHPAQLIEGRRNRKVAQKIYSIEGHDFLMRVIFKETANEVNVVTAYLTTKIDKYWKRKP